MSIRRIHMTVNVEDIVDSGTGIASDCGATDEVVSKIRAFVNDNMFSDYVTVEVTEISISDGDDWRVAT